MGQNEKSYDKWAASAAGGSRTDRWTTRDVKHLQHDRAYDDNDDNSNNNNVNNNNNDDSADNDNTWALSLNVLSLLLS